MKEIGYIKFVVFINSLVPFALLGWDAVRGNLGANPQEFAIRTTGALALIFLLISLLVTPLRKMLGFPWMVKLRRMLGLYGFFYAVLHLLTYTWFDKGFRFGEILSDTLQRKFIFVGMFSFILLVPLAITSTDAMIKKIGGRKWNRLHKLSYAAAAGGVIHYWLLVKADTTIPIAFGIVLVGLLIYRLLNRYLPDITQRRVRRASVND